MPDALGGLAGYVISGLAGMLSVLAGANAVQWNAGNKMHRARIEDLNTHSEALQQLMLQTNKAVAEIADASRRRNEVTEKLMELITQQGHAFAIFAEHYRLQQATTERDLEAAIAAVKAMADALRMIDRTTAETARIVAQNSVQAQSVIAMANDTNSKVTAALNHLSERRAR